MRTPPAGPAGRARGGPGRGGAGTAATGKFRPGNLPVTWLVHGRGVTAEAADAEPACLFVDPEVFFPASYGAAHRRQVDLAKAVCARCPRTAQCLALALATDEEFGIWGGTTPRERRRLRLRRHPWRRPALAGRRYTDVTQPQKLGNAAAPGWAP